MDVTSDVSTRKVEAFWKEVAVQRNESFLDNELEQQCMISNKFGTTFSIDSYKILIENWFNAFEYKSAKVKSSVLAGEIISSVIQLEVKHIGNFAGLEASGKNITLESSCDMLIIGNSISFMSTILDNNSVILQIANKESNQYKEALSPCGSKNLMFRFFEDTIRYLNFLGFKLCQRQLQVLSLWITGRSDTDIAHILDIQPRTVNCYQRSLRDIFNSHKKYMIYDQLAALQLTHIINQCLFFLLSNKTNKNLV